MFLTLLRVVVDHPGTRVEVPGGPALIVGRVVEIYLPEQFLGELLQLRPCSVLSCNVEACGPFHVRGGMGPGPVGSGGPQDGAGWVGEALGCFGSGFLGSVLLVKSLVVAFGIFFTVHT